MTADPRENTTVRSGGGGTQRHATRGALGNAPHEQLDDAVAAEKWARAVELLLQHGERMLVDGRAAALDDWLGRIPDTAFQKEYRLGLLAAWVAVYVQRYRDATARLVQAERALQHQIIADDIARRSGQGGETDFVTNPWAEARLGIDAIRAHLRAATGDAPAGAEGVDGMMLAASADHPVWRAEALVILARSRFLAGEPERAAIELADALALAGTSGASRARRAEGDALVLLGRMAELRGDAERAFVHYEAVSDRCGAAYAGALIGRARISLARLALVDARAAIAEALRRLGEMEGTAQVSRPDPWAVMLDGAVVEAEIAAVIGEHVEARSRIDALERDLKTFDIRWLQDFLAPVRMRLALLRDDLPHLRRQVQQLATTRSTGRGLVELTLQIALAWAHLRLDAPSDAVQVATAAAEAARLALFSALEHEARLIIGIGLAKTDGGPQAAEVGRAALAGLGSTHRTFAMLLAGRVTVPDAAAGDDPNVAGFLTELAQLVEAGRAPIVGAQSNDIEVSLPVIEAAPEPAVVAVADTSDATPDETPAAIAENETEVAAEPRSPAH